MTHDIKIINMLAEKTSNNTLALIKEHIINEDEQSDVYTVLLLSLTAGCLSARMGQDATKEQLMQVVNEEFDSMFTNIGIK